MYYMSFCIQEFSKMLIINLIYKNELNCKKIFENFENLLKNINDKLENKKQMGNNDKNNMYENDKHDYQKKKNYLNLIMKYFEENCDKINDVEICEFLHKKFLKIEKLNEFEFEKKIDNVNDKTLFYISFLKICFVSSSIKSILK